MDVYAALVENAAQGNYTPPPPVPTAVNEGTQTVVIRPLRHIIYMSSFGMRFHINPNCEGLRNATRPPSQYLSCALCGFDD